MSEVQQLYRLQLIDTEISQKKQRLGEVLKAQKETEELLLARQRAKSAETELMKFHTQHKNLSLELESLVNKTKRSENRLYSGKVTNPKELTDLQHEIESLGRRRASLEDDILEAMIMSEDAETEKTAADESLATIEEKWQKALIDLQKEQNELALRLHELGEMRQKQIPLIKTGTLTDYEHILKRSHGLAVAILKENICQGCQLNVSAYLVKKVHEGDLINCNNCGRILSPKW